MIALMSFFKLGDFLLLTPLLRALEESEGVQVAVPDPLWSLYAEAKVFTQAIPAREAEELLRHVPDPRAIDLTFPLLPAEKLATKVPLLPKEPFRQARHVTASYEEALRKLFPRLPRTKPAPWLQLAQDPRVFKTHELEPYSYFTVHAGSDFAPKNWPSASHESVITEILKKRPELKCVSLVGPCDQELFMNGGKPARFQTARAPLREVAHLLAGSLFHLDNDSGIHHLAGALDTPSITVFGPTGPGTWCSVTDKNFVHWGGPSCADHCGGARMVTCSERVCLTAVKPAAVVASAERILSSYVHIA